MEANQTLRSVLSEKEPLFILHLSMKNPEMYKTETLKPNSTLVGINKTRWVGLYKNSEW